MIALLVFLTIYWYRQPVTPQEFYQVRCSNCHELPDLSDYQKHEFAPLVNFMRTHNGASRKISEQEAKIIINYLEANWQSHPRGR